MQKLVSVLRYFEVYEMAHSKSELSGILEQNNFSFALIERVLMNAATLDDLIQASTPQLDNMVMHAFIKPLEAERFREWIHTLRISLLGQQPLATTNHAAPPPRMPPQFGMPYTMMSAAEPAPTTSYLSMAGVRGFTPHQPPVYVPYQFNPHQFPVWTYQQGQHHTVSPNLCAPHTRSPQVHPQSEHRTGRWSDDEHKLFLTLMKKYGRSWTKIASVMKSRTEPQVRSHAQKYFQKQARQAEHQRAQQIRLDAARGERDAEPDADTAKDATTPVTTDKVESGSDDDDARAAAGEPASHDSDHELSLTYSFSTEDETTTGEYHNPAL